MAARLRKPSLQPQNRSIIRTKTDLASEAQIMFRLSDRHIETSHFLRLQRGEELDANALEPPLARAFQRARRDAQPAGQGAARGLLTAAARGILALETPDKIGYR
jgi:hypothetical protein